MRQFAQVLSTSDSDNKAKVVIRKHSACGKCGKCGSGNNMKLVVSNELGAESGDMVVLEMKETSLLSAALLIYVLPLIGLLGGYFLGVGLGFKSELLRIVTGFVLFALSFLGARKFGDYNEKNYDVEMSRIIN